MRVYFLERRFGIVSGWATTQARELLREVHPAQEVLEARVRAQVVE